ncbi:MAG: ABC transporter permease [Hyphomicrobiaceae bacterium]|nr:ABC transporter permease [Hyphomicrobiaceae bacterium]MCP5323732.1 ABC transporter permease [Paracoccaceae bacterium]
MTHLQVNLSENRMRRQKVLRRALSHRSFVIGFVGVGIVLLLAILAPLVTWHDPYAQSIIDRRLPPIWYGWFWDDPLATWNHPLGTDQLGRDYWSRLVYGGRISLFIGLTATLVSGLIGTTLGILAGYFGGRTDMVISFLITTRLTMPVILVALATVALFNSSLMVVTLVLGLLLWDRFAVVTRSATMQVRSMEYVTAAKSIGSSTPRILLTEILPNIAAPLIVIATIEMATAILYEAALSFLGLGVQPPLPSWGLVLAQAKDDIFFAPWMITLPGIALFVLLLSINLLGDGVRDLTSPEGR